MEILVINGSPKGKNSVALQTIHYLQLLHPEHHFEILHAGQNIRAPERDFSPAIAAVEKAGFLLFSYPIYTFIAPCQLHRFIELLKEARPDLSGKYASQISTSKHFYDVTAHRYIQDNCGDPSREQNLQTIIEARAQVGSNYLAGIATDEQDTDAGIDQLCAKLTYAPDNRYLPPQNFYGIAGMLVPYKKVLEKAEKSGNTAFS